jgi:hypothetical protein
VRLRLLTNVAALMGMAAVLTVVLTAAAAVVGTEYWFGLTWTKEKAFPGWPGMGFFLDFTPLSL